MSDIAPERSRRKGKGGRIVAMLLLVAALAAGGYWIWQNYRDQLTGMVGSLTGSGGQTSSNQAQKETDGQAGDTARPKDNVRLDGKGETVEAEPVAASDTSEPVKEEPPVVLDQADQAAAGEQAAGGEDQLSQSAAASGNDAQPMVADRAFLYTESAGGQGANLAKGNVVWKLDGPADDPVIHADMDVPDKGLVMTLEISRNMDAAISASHLINLRFVVPEDFEGRNVDNVARFVMKKSEQAVGEPLIGVPAKIIDGSFIIALDNLEKASKVNETLLLNSNWVDIPLVFSTGVRALVTLEKGREGEAVFNKAFAAWNKS